MNVRLGEESKGWYRSGRYLQVNGQWFFATREQTEVGPFPSRGEAEKASRNYIRRKKYHVQNWLDSLFVMD